MTTDGLVADCRHRLTQLDVGSRILIAYSGGLDSSVLVDALARAYRRGGPRPELVHVDHGMRPSSADDARFCRRMADRYGFTIEIETLDLDPSAGQQRARTARMAAIAQCALARGIDDVAFAHHGDDRVESLLLHLRRGTGLDGLAPMPPLDRFPVPGCELRVVRPLVDRTRSRLEDYADRHDVDFVTDPTNRTDRYERNRIRHHVLPELLVDSGARHRAIQAIDHLGREREAADRQADDLEAEAALFHPGLRTRAFDRSALRRAPAATVARLFLRLAPRLDASSIERIHDAIREAGARPHHLTLSGCVVTVVRNRVVFRPSEDRGGRDVLNRRARPVRLEPLEGGSAPFFGASIRWELCSGDGPAGADDRWEAIFDADRLEPPLRLEGFVDGARLVRTDPDGETYHQKLTKLMSARRVDADCRWRWPCVYDDRDRLIWPAGLARGAAAVADERTDRIWRVTVAPADDLTEIIQP